MENNNEFININDIINRDLLNKYDLYQVNANKNTIDLTYLGKLNKIPTQHIVSFNHPKYKNIKCEVVSYILSKDEINVSKYLKMIGILIHIEDKIIYTFDYVFEPTCKIQIDNIELKKNISNINGIFKMMLIGNNKEIEIKKYNEYIGKEESIYILITTLFEENVIDKYK
jgi:hypothetical protein